MKKKMISSGNLLLRITLFVFTFSMFLVYFSSNYMRDIAVNNLAEDDAKKTSELAFEVLYTKMQDGWSRDDLYKIIDRLNNLKPGLTIHTYRSTLVEQLFGEVESEQNGKADPYIQRAFKGETIFLPVDNDKKMRYIRPMLIKQECITCHSNTKEGDINGVIDMTFPENDIRIPLDTIISYFLLFTLIAIVITFFVFQYIMTKTFVQPISLFANSIRKVIQSGDYSKEVLYNPKTIELDILGKTFNELLSKVHATLDTLSNKNKSLEEYKKAIDHATIVSKANTKGVITYVNDKFCAISGYSEEELIGQNHNIVRSSHMPKEVFKDLWNTIENKQTWSGIVENRAKNGESYFVQATIIPILDENNEIVEYIGIRQDITELKALQFDEINNSVNQALDVRFQDILDYIPVSAAIVDKSSNLLFTNDIFNNKLAYLDGNKITIDTLFINQTGYVSNTSIIDFKDEVISLQDSCMQKVLINIFGADTEFYITIKKLDINSLYLILLFDIDNNLF